MSKIKNKYPLIVLSLLLLFNPSVNLIDVLPDCIAYLLLLLVIGGLGETVPYLTECKSALVKLALVTLVKIPAFTVMYSNLNTGKDIVPLFTLVFVTLELILLYSAVTNGYRALAYIGERTDCASVRDPFTIGKKRTSTPEELRLLSYIFFAARGILNVVPELLNLTPEDASLRRRLAEAYPTVLILCIFSALLIGTVWLVYATKYASAIKRGGDIGEGIASLTHKGTPDEIATESMLKRLISSLTMLAVSSLFIFDVSIEDFGGYNILPHFIYGILVFISVYSWCKSSKTRTALSVGTVLYSISSLVVYSASKSFADRYSYIDLRYSEAARSAYSTIKIFAVIELVCALVMLCAAALATIEFIKEHTDVSPKDPSYSRANEKNHKATVRSTMPVFIISAIIHAMKLANVFIKQTTVILETAVNENGIVTSGVPAIDTIIFLTCAVYVICAFVKTSNLKDEVKFKYGKK